MKVKETNHEKYGPGNDVVDYGPVKSGGASVAPTPAAVSVPNDDDIPF